MEGMVALFIPIVSVVCLLAGVALMLKLRQAQDRERNETLRRMIDKGIEIPPALLVPPHRPASDLRRGLVLVGLGLGLTILLLSIPDHDARKHWAVGLIPLLMGGGYLASWRITAQKA